MIVAGIDPGKTGALFIYDADCGCNAVFDVPCALMKVAGKKTKRPTPLYDQWHREWLAILTANQVDHIFIELVGGGMIGGQKQSGSSMFGFGKMAGFAHAIAVASGIGYTFITPQAWKKAVGTSGSDGNKSRARASQLFPGCDSLWPLVKHDGRAEAALIAFAGKLKLEGASSDKGDVHGRGANRSSAREEGTQDVSGGSDRLGDQPNRRPQQVHTRKGARPDRRNAHPRSNRKAARGKSAAKV